MGRMGATSIAFGSGDVDKRCHGRNVETRKEEENWMGGRRVGRRGSWIQIQKRLKTSAPPVEKDGELGKKGNGINHQTEYVLILTFKVGCISIGVYIHTSRQRPNASIKGRVARAKTNLEIWVAPGRSKKPRPYCNGVKYENGFAHAKVVAGRRFAKSGSPDSINLKVLWTISTNGTKYPQRLTRKFGQKPRQEQKCTQNHAHIRMR